MRRSSHEIIRNNQKRSAKVFSGSERRRPRHAQLPTTVIDFIMYVRDDYLKYYNEKHSKKDTNTDKLL